MPRINLLNYNFNALVMLVCSYLVLFSEVEISTNVFFIILFSFAVIQKSFNYKYKKVFSSILALATIYILFVLNDQTLSKEYFINLILGLIFLKYSEIEKKENHYFFGFSCVFLAISSLIYGQDLISSFLSFIIILLSIIHLYSLNQTKILKLNLNNLFRYLIFALSIIPIIAIIYFVFPRAELNIKLFETKKNQLGIPDKISLGSFQNISDSEENVFIFKTNIQNEDQKYYFRVKVFDKLSISKDWLNSEYKILLAQFKNSFKVSNPIEKQDVDASLIMFPHEKKWFPKLDNYNFENSNLNLNLINNTLTTNKIVTNKKSYKLIYDKRDVIYQKKLLDFYTLLPNNISPKLKQWAKTNFENANDPKDYLEKILNEFKNNNFFYSLTPVNQGNDYENFFFNTKTGYCEYYAGTFTILARLAGIPARIVTGYYGGSYNNLGDFYTFKQRDAHSWVEIFIDNNWVLYDPTLSVPNENILNSNNSNFESFETSTVSPNNEQKIDISRVGIYFEYINYVWTNSFLRYDEKSRSNFIKEKLSNVNNYKYFLIIIFFSIFFIYAIKFINFVISKKFLFTLFFKNLKKKNKNISEFMTHQEIFNSLKKNDQLKCKSLFDFYENLKFSKNFKISLKNFYLINIKILRYAYFKK
ncbi:transglutaminaseTgpA domain-containing protein [Candidatus Pelagibacter sp.]|nr:transglutaminaseTgpA domain-containing protein [Candidatus Pelagibacter sp.]